MYEDGLRSLFPGMSKDESERPVPDWTSEQAKAFDEWSQETRKMFAEFLLSKKKTSPYQLTQEENDEWTVIINNKYKAAQQADKEQPK